MRADRDFENIILICAAAALLALALRFGCRPAEEPVANRPVTDTLIYLVKIPLIYSFEDSARAQYPGFKLVEIQPVGVSWDSSRGGTEAWYYVVLAKQGP